MSAKPVCYLTICYNTLQHFLKMIKNTLNVKINVNKIMRAWNINIFLLSFNSEDISKEKKKKRFLQLFGLFQASKSIYCSFCSRWHWSESRRSNHRFEDVGRGSSLVKTRFSFLGFLLLGFLGTWDNVHL